MGEEAAKEDIDDPWPKQKAGSSKGGEDLPEPLSTPLLDETLPISARDLWRLVMADPEFLSSVQELNKHREPKIGRWQLTKGARAWSHKKHLPACCHPHLTESASHAALSFCSIGECLEEH